MTLSHSVGRLLSLVDCRSVQWPLLGPRATGWQQQDERKQWPVYDLALRGGGGRWRDRYDYDGGPGSPTLVCFFATYWNTAIIRETFYWNIHNTHLILRAMGLQVLDNYWRRWTDDEGGWWCDLQVQGCVHRDVVEQIVYLHEAGL